MSKHIKIDRKPPDQRVVASINGPVGKLLGLKTKSIWTYLVCCIEGCSNSTSGRGAALCALHKELIRKAQYGLASTRYRDTRTGKNKLSEKRILGRVNGRPSYRALMNPVWALKAMKSQKHQTGQLSTPEGRALFQKLLSDRSELLTNMEASARAVKRNAKRIQKKAHNANMVERNRKLKAKSGIRKEAPVAAAVSA